LRDGGNYFDLTQLPDKVSTTLIIKAGASEAEEREHITMRVRIEFMKLVLKVISPVAPTELTLYELLHEELKRLCVFDASLLKVKHPIVPPELMVYEHLYEKLKHE
jgi:hypothetical protein